MNELIPPPLLTADDQLTIRDVMERISTFGSQVLVVVDQDNKVVGIVTDGDLRRGLLAGKTLSDSYAEILNSTPLVTTKGKDEIAEFAARNSIRHVIRVDDEGRLLSFHISDFSTWNPPSALILAGGRGERLRPHTLAVPKPLLEVGDMPIIERIIRDLVLSGIKKIHFSLGYLSEEVIDFLKSLKLDGLEFSYSVEGEQLGTAGPAIDFLLNKFQGENLLVVNGDLMATPDYHRMIRNHQEGDCALTVMSVEAKTQIQFGVLEVKDQLVTQVREKPEVTFLVSGGVYLIRRDAIERYFQPGHIDMPDVINFLAENHERVGVYHYSGQWFDIGRPEELEMARLLFRKSSDELG